MENCDKYFSSDTNNIDILVEGMLKFNECESSNRNIYLQNGCLVGNPGTLLSYARNSVQKSNFVIPLSLFGGILVSIITLAGRLLIHEEKLGWKRLSIVLGCVIAFITPIAIALLADDFQNQDELIFSILISLLLIPFVTIILVLKGRAMSEWVKEGFSKLMYQA